MTAQQKLLWEKLTKEVRDQGMDNFHARELYDELSKLLNMSDKVLISISEKPDGIEVRVAEDAYDNLAVIGLLERIKFSLLEGVPVQGEKEVKPIIKQKYDA
jgi:hypothetical protein